MMSAFWASLTSSTGSVGRGAGLRAGLGFGLCLLGLHLGLAGGMSLCWPDTAEAASHLSAPRSGLEAPGGPRPLDRLPAAGRPSGTVYGNPGYTDAYGNTLDDIPPPEAKPRKRLPPGAYGTYGNGGGNRGHDRPLPEPDAGSTPPAWSFQ